MVYFLIGLMAAVPFLFLRRQVPRDCPNCHRQFPMLYAPWNWTRRQWAKGGFVCPACKVEVDLQGKQVSHDEPPIRISAFLRVMVPALLAPALILFVSYFVFCWGKGLISQQVMAAEVAFQAQPIVRRQSPIANTFDAGREEIRARIVLHEHGLVHRGDLYSFGVEFENLSLGRAAWVEFDAQDVKLEITDDRGHIVPRSSVQRSGPALPVCRAMVPPAGYTVFSTHDQGMGIVGGQNRFNAGYEAWHLTLGRYQISGSVLARIAFAQKDESDDDPFAKDQPKLKLSIPTFELAVSK